MPIDQTPAFEGWAVLELMGHRRLAGYLSEVTIGGGAFIRIDIPGTEPEGPEAAYEHPIITGIRTTQFYAPASVYCITPTTEELARSVAKRAQPAPVSRFELEPVRPIDVEPDDEDDF